VASTIAEATNNGLGLTGLAYGVTVMPVRVLDDFGGGDASDIAAGVRYAVRHGAKVINLSLEFELGITASEIPELVEALAYAHRRGVFLVGASGNEAHRSVAYPARARYVVSVGSTTERGCVSDFSNQGRDLDIVAPGGGADASIRDDPHCRPDLRHGRDIYQVTLQGGPRNRRFGIPFGYEGTSMAAPHVAAAAALVIASRVIGAKPTPDAIEQRLKDTARDLGAPGPDVRYGAGLLDAAAATAPPAAAEPTPVPAR
jgi:serine protease